MNTLKSVMVVGALAVVGYGVYAMLNNNPSPTTPPWPTTGSDAPSANSGGPPNVTMGNPSSPPGAPVATAPPGPGAASPLPGYPAAGSAPPLAAANRTSLPGPLPPGPTSPGIIGAPLAPPSQPGLYGQPAMPGAGTPQSGVAMQPRYGAPPAVGQSLVPPGVVPPGVGPPGVVSPGVGQPGASVQPFQFDTTMSAARAQLNRGKLDDALLTLSLIYDDDRLTDRQQEQLNELLDQVAGTVIYSRTYPVGEPHAVKAGEDLRTIAQQYDVPEGLLAKINGVTPRDLVPGQQLKVMRGPFQATVNVPKRTLTLMVEGRYAGRFFVSLGEEFKQIQGTYVINAKTLEHTRYDGQRYLELKPAGPAPAPPITLAIVGMADPTVAERGQAQGLIAVSPQNADDLYDILSQGSKVTIRR